MEKRSGGSPGSNILYPTQLVGKNKTARAVTVLTYKGLITSCVTNRWP
jgi:hypothetical protein